MALDGPFDAICLKPSNILFLGTPTHGVLANHRSGVLGICGLLLSQGFLFAQPISVDIQQVKVDLPSVTVYLDILGPDRKRVISLDPKDARAVLGSKWIQFASLQSFEQTGEGVAYVVLVDISRSVGRLGFEEARSGLKAFIKGMSSRDRLAMITLSDEPRMIQDFTSDQSTLVETLERLEPAESRTALYAGMVDALQRLRGRADLPNRRAVLVFTDGQNDDDMSGKSEEDVRSAIKETHIPIFAMGISQEPPPPDADFFLAALAGFASSSHGAYLRVRQDTPTIAYDNMRNAIRRVYVGTFTCGDCPQDGLHHPLKVVVKDSESAVAQVALFPPRPADVLKASPPTTAPTPTRSLSSAQVAIGFLSLGLVAVLLFFLLRKNKTSGPPPTKPQPGPRPEWRITLSHVGGRGEDISATFSDKLVVGTDSSCDLRVGDSSIRGRHCEIFARSGQLYLRSLNSSRDTMVDGKPASSELKIDWSSEVRLGTVLFHVKMERLR